MPNREAPPGIVPRVFCEDGGGYSYPARCALCGISLRTAALVWAGLPNDPPGLVRPLHAACVNEYTLYRRAVDLPETDVTPCS